ncbi:MAG: cytochrome c3 family protein [Candidatus Rokubacteria bacterium]|nr:cytochrome c3 family protein [Candidatus Rokubacteria bacterium]
MKWPALIGMVALGLVSWAGFRLWVPPEVVQPIQFPHKTHIELNLECTSCHERAEKGSVAGRPPTALCLSCHSAGEGTGEIKKVQAYEKGGEIPWRRVWRLPDHIFFPHRTHVVVAKLKCQTCHGPMETLVKPPARPLKTLSMEDCIGCHEKAGASAEKVAARARGPASGIRPLSTDCNSCHR